MNYDHAKNFREHFILPEDFEAARKEDHSGLFTDVSTACPRSVVLLEEWRRST